MRQTKRPAARRKAGKARKRPATKAKAKKAAAS